MTLKHLAALAVIAILAGAVIGYQAGHAPAAYAHADTQDAPPEPSPQPSPTNQPIPTPVPTDRPQVRENANQTTNPERRPLTIPSTDDPFVWGPRTYHEDGFPERVWFTKQGRSGELAADLVVLLRGETLEFGAGLYELTGMVQVDEFGVWAAFLPSDMTLITSTGFNATTGDWKYRVIFLFHEVQRNGNQN